MFTSLRLREGVLAGVFNMPNDSLLDVLLCASFFSGKMSVSDPEAGCGDARFLPRLGEITCTFFGEFGDDGGENTEFLVRGLRIVDGGVDVLVFSGDELKRGEGVPLCCAATLVERRGE